MLLARQEVLASVLYKLDPEEALDVISTEERKVFSGGQLDSRYVPGEGTLEGATAMVIGEAPGAQEAMARRPFVGPCRVIRELMELAGLWCNYSDFRPPYGPTQAFQENAWLTNVVKFRPPGNRNPTHQEVSLARPFLLAEWITAGRPRIIVPCGGISLAAVMGKPTSITRVAGSHLTRSAKTDGKTMHIFPMLHPAYALRNPDVQPNVERHWQLLGEFLARHK